MVGGLAIFLLLAVTTENLKGITTAQDSPETQPLFEDVVNMTLTFPGRIFSSDMTDSSSLTYQSFNVSFCTEVVKKVMNFYVAQEIESYKGNCSVTRLQPGSVVVYFTFVVLVRLPDNAQHVNFFTNLFISNKGSFGASWDFDEATLQIFSIAILHKPDFPNNTLMWVDDLSTIMFSTDTAAWLQNSITPAVGRYPFNDPRKLFEGIAFHHAWRYTVVSDRGTNTIVVVQRDAGNAVYGHVGTTSGVGHVAVDWLSNNLYWADSGFGWIGMQGLTKRMSMMSSDGRLKVVVSTSLDRPYGIAVLPTIRRIFWTDNGARPKLESAGLLGEDRKTLVWQGLARPTGVTVDHVAQQVYWVDQAKGTVESCDVNGLKRHRVVSLEGSSIGGLEVFQEYIILTERQNSKIMAFSKETGQQATTPINNVANASDITVYSSSLQARQNDSCYTRKCNHICIQPGRCECSSGYVLDSDGLTCKITATALWKSFLISNRTSVCSVPVNLLFSHMYLPQDVLKQKTRCFLFNASADIRHLAVDARNATLFYVSGREIRRYSIQAARDDVVYSASSDITGLAYDWIRYVLVWCQQIPGNHSILALRQGEFSPTVLYSGLTNPVHVAVHPQRGTIFWIEQTPSENDQIWAGSMLSEPKTMVLKIDLVQPQNLVYDDRLDRLFWLDTNNVGSVSKDGSNRHVQPINSTAQNSGLAIFRGYLVWAYRSSSTASLTFRSSDLTSVQTPVSFSLVSNIIDPTDLVFYDAFENTADPSSTCELDNGNCSQLCLVNGSSHQCQCQFGFTMQADGRTCAATYANRNFFLLVDSLYSDLYQMTIADPKSPSAAQFKEGTRPELVTFNNRTGQIIWYDSQAAAIMSSFLDGTSVSMVKSLKIGQGANVVRSMRVDQTTNNLYFTEINPNYSNGSIRVISLESKKSRTLLTITSSPPVFLDINPAKGTLVYGTLDGNIYGSSMALDQPTHLHSARPGLSGLVLADNGLSIVWSNTEVDEIGKMFLDTPQPQQLLYQSSARPKSLQVQGSILYYLTGSGRSVRSINNAPNSVETPVVELTEFGNLSALFVFGEPVSVTNACSNKNGGCSTLCLPIPDGRRCQCEDGLSLQGDALTCQNVERCPNSIQNGKLVSSCSRLPGETCDYYCSDGYAKNGSIPHILCTSTGQWKVDVDRLCLLTCPADVGASLKVQVDCDRTVGSNCSLSCGSNFDLQGVTWATCGGNGKWVVQPTTRCQPSEPVSLPAYAIAIIAAGSVAVITLVIGCILFRRWKRYGGRDSNRKKGDLPTIVFINGPASQEPLSLDALANRQGPLTLGALANKGAVGGVKQIQIPDVTYTPASEEYAELDQIDSELRYQSFSKISPSVGRKAQDRGGITNVGMVLYNDDAKTRSTTLQPSSHYHYHITDPEPYDDEGEYIEPIADVARLSAGGATASSTAVTPRPHGPSTSHTSNYLTPNYKPPGLAGVANGTTAPILPPRDTPGPSLLPPPPNPHRSYPQLPSATARPHPHGHVEPGYTTPYTRAISSPLPPSGPAAGDGRGLPNLSLKTSQGNKDWTA